MIYFDNAATTQMSEAALSALMEISSECYGNPSSAYSFGRRAKEVITNARRIIADCIGALPEEIYFTSCGTESDNWAISQCVSHGVNRIITSRVEHHAVLNPVKKYELLGISTDYLPVNRECVVCSDVLKNMMTGEKVLASIMFQNNETGTIQPIKDIAQIIHDDNIDSIVHTDAVQAVGHVEMDVNDLGVDMLSASAHKFNGPKGIGFLYVKKSLGVSPYILGGGQERGMRSGTENVAEIFAMAIALEDNVKHIKENKARISHLETVLLDELNTAGIEYCINGDSNSKADGLLNISIKNVDGEGLLNMLDTHNICISIGSACNSKSKDLSHVLSAMDLSKERIDSAVRISIGRYNSETEVRELSKRICQFYRLTQSVI